MLSLRAFDVVRDAAQASRVPLEVEHAVGRAGIAVARLADRPDVDQQPTPAGRRSSSSAVGAPGSSIGARRKRAGTCVWPNRQILRRGGPSRAPRRRRRTRSSPRRTARRGRSRCRSSPAADPSAVRQVREVRGGAAVVVHSIDDARMSLKSVAARDRRRPCRGCRESSRPAPAPRGVDDRRRDRRRSRPRSPSTSTCVVPDRRRVGSTASSACRLAWMSLRISR